MKDERKSTSRRETQSVDVEALAVAARARRVAVCELEVQAAIAPILARYRCRLGTVQEIVDGRPGLARVVVMAVD
jgi:hypothetical protein